MGILYKPKEEIEYNVNIIRDTKKINFLFYNNGGKHGTDEILDEYTLTPLKLLEILQAYHENETD